MSKTDDHRPDVESEKSLVRGRTSGEISGSHPPAAAPPPEARARLVEPFAPPATDSAARHQQLAPGIAVVPLRTPTLPPATHTNCYLLGRRELVIVDPASPYDDERAALDRIVDAEIARGSRVAAIWLTHHHVDHVGGVAHLSARLGVPVAAHARTAEILASGRGPGARISIDHELRDGDVVEFGAAGETGQPGESEHSGDTESRASEPPVRLRVVFTPGHAPGHVCILEEHTRFLIAGDMVAGIGSIVIDPDEGHMGQYLASLGRMRDLAPAALLPAHGPLLRDPAATIDHYVKHRMWREARVVEALRQHGPATARALVPMVYADVPAGMHKLAERSLLAHLIKLAEDSVAAAEGALWRIVAPAHV